MAFQFFRNHFGLTSTQHASELYLGDPLEIAKQKCLVDLLRHVELYVLHDMKVEREISIKFGETTSPMDVDRTTYEWTAEVDPERRAWLLL